jgi:hypothetical protein
LISVVAIGIASSRASKNLSPYLMTLLHLADRLKLKAKRAPETGKIETIPERRRSFSPFLN